MGKHTMHENDNAIEHLSESMRENRELMVEFCVANEFKVANTMFRKPLDRTATYRNRKEINQNSTQHINTLQPTQPTYQGTTNNQANQINH